MRLKTRRILLATLHTTLTLLCMAVAFVGLLFFGLNLAYRSSNVIGSSMIPNFYDGDYVLIERYSEPEVGDVIIATPSWTKNAVIKRLIGKPGDTVKIIKTDRYELYCNDTLIYTKDLSNSKKYDEYNSFPNANDDGSITLGEDEYLIMGDNWYVSADSLTSGSAIKRSQIAGRVGVLIDRNENKFWALLSYSLKGVFSI